MKMKLRWYASLVPVLLFVIACDTSLTVGSKTVGIRSGEFIYMDGYLRTTYNAPLEKVWDACEQTLTELKATDVERIKKIGTRNFTAMILDDKVRIDVAYVEKNLTAVSVMVGSSGNNLASQLIHERIAKSLRP